MIDDSLYAYMNEILRRIPVSFVRYMYTRINWKDRLVGITGPRGVGKSTMVLQHILRHKTEGSHLYVSADYSFSY